MYCLMYLPMLNLLNKWIIERIDSVSDFLIGPSCSWLSSLMKRFVARMAPWTTPDWCNIPRPLAKSQMYLETVVLDGFRGFVTRHLSRSPTKASSYSTNNVL